MIMKRTISASELPRRLFFSFWSSWKGKKQKNEMLSILKSKRTKMICKVKLFFIWNKPVLVNVLHFVKYLSSIEAVCVKYCRTSQLCHASRKVVNRTSSHKWLLLNTTNPLICHKIVSVILQVQDTVIQKNLVQI